MRASKLSAATRRRRSALLERRNRGLELTCDKRSRLRDMATSNRHCAQYAIEARRKGLLAPSKEWRDL